MDEEIDRVDVLTRASAIAERALVAATQDENLSIPLVERETWLTATVIHCDILRMMVALDQCPPEGIARLLWYGDIASALMEAKAWFFNKGNKNLISLAEAKGLDGKSIRSQLRQLADLSPLHELDKYSDYRNKVGHHYDHGLLEHLHTFSTMDAQQFFRLLTNYAEYSTGWVRLCKSVLQLP